MTDLSKESLALKQTIDGIPTFDESDPMYISKLVMVINGINVLSTNNDEKAFQLLLRFYPSISVLPLSIQIMSNHELGKWYLFHKKYTKAMEYFNFVLSKVPMLGKFGVFETNDHDSYKMLYHSMKGICTCYYKLGDILNHEACYKEIMKLLSEKKQVDSSYLITKENLGWSVNWILEDPEYKKWVIDNDLNAIESIKSVELLEEGKLKLYKSPNWKPIKKKYRPLDKKPDSQILDTLKISDNEVERKNKEIFLAKEELKKKEEIHQQPTLIVDKKEYKEHKKDKKHKGDKKKKKKNLVKTRSEATPSEATMSEEPEKKVKLSTLDKVRVNQKVKKESELIPLVPLTVPIPGTSTTFGVSKTKKKKTKITLDLFLMNKDQLDP